MQRTADLVILGGGSGGYACALRAAQLGKSVILIEQDKLGGTCLHRGCIPTKALLHAAEVADSAREGARFGVSTVFEGIDLPGVNSYKDDVVGRLYKGLQGLVKSRNVELVTGAGTLIDAATVEVDGVRYTGTNVVLATGSYAKTLPDVKIGDRIVTSDQALTLTEVPKRVIVLGGGVIGVEFASVWRSFGAEVTIVEALPRLLANEDEFISKYLDRALRRRGIEVRTAVAVSSAEAKDHKVTVSLNDGEQLEADLVLVAVGRGPNTGDSGFTTAGIHTANGFVTTDDSLRTNLPGVYAVGDIVSGLQLAHRGFQQGIFVAEHIAGLDPAPIDEKGIPRVAYCEPEAASVGLTEDAARESYSNVETVIYDLAGNGKSQILRTQGAIKLVKANTGDGAGTIVGVHMVGSRVGELIGEAQLVYNWHAEAGDIAPFIHAHPSQHEAFGEASLALSGKPLHAHA